jgi:hypothetical protein
MRRARRALRIAAVAMALAPAGMARAQVATAPPAPVMPAPVMPAPVTRAPSPQGSETVPAAPQPPPDIWLPRPVAELQALDKVSARVTPLAIRVGQSATFGALTIFVRACLVRPPEQPADAAMFLDITDQHPGAPQFHGWMILSAPAVAMLEHPVYDLRPTACHG